MNEYLDSKACGQLTDEQSVTYVTQLMKEMRDEDDLADALLNLALYTNGNCLQAIYPQLLEREVFYPSAIYLHAKDSIALEIINLIPQQEDELSIGQLLSCLAWIGSDSVVKFFDDTEKNKPSWSEELFLPAGDYTLDAGWCLEDGKKRILFNPPSKQFIGHPIHCEATCPVCKGHLTTLLNIDGITYTTCLLCCCHYPVFMKLDANNKGVWHEKTEPQEYEELDIQNTSRIHNALEMTTDISPVPDTSNAYPEREHSQIGGYPTWIQGADYLSCPDCKRKMTYVAQVNFSEYMTYGEGIYYFHLCLHCRVTGSNFQQA